jgi:hypothetical protein
VIYSLLNVALLYFLACVCVYMWMCTHTCVCRHFRSLSDVLLPQPDVNREDVLLWIMRDYITSPVLVSGPYDVSQAQGNVMKGLAQFTKLGCNFEMHAPLCIVASHYTWTYPTGPSCTPLDKANFFPALSSTFFPVSCSDPGAVSCNNARDQVGIVLVVDL